MTPQISIRSIGDILIQHKFHSPTGLPNMYVNVSQTRAALALALAILVTHQILCEALVALISPAQKTQLTPSESNCDMIVREIHSFFY